MVLVALFGEDLRDSYAVLVADLNDLSACENYFAIEHYLNRGSDGLIQFNHVSRPQVAEFAKGEPGLADPR